MSSARSHASPPTESGQRALAVVRSGDDDVRGRRIDLTLERAGFHVRTASHVDELAGASEIPTNIVVLACDALASDDLDAIASAKEDLPRAAVVVVATAAIARDIRAALERGADGIVIDADLERTLVATVHAVSAGQLVIPPAFRDQARQPVFSAREKEILSMVVLGLRNGEIAGRLYLSESTVKTHLASAFRKLGVRSRKEATTAILDPGSGFGYGILGITKDSEAENRSPIGEPLPRAKLLASRVRMPRHVAHRSFIRETVILDVRSGTYHKVNATGGRMLHVLDRSASVGDAVIELAAEYEKQVEEIEDDICEFSIDLIGRGLLKVSGERP